MGKTTVIYYRAATTGKQVPTTMLFCLLWLLMFALYYPAAKAGFVTDFTGWLDQVKNHTFLEHINRTNFHAKSLYQFTQFNTWVCYKLFGIHRWLWHLLFITLHVINACLLFKLVTRLLDDAGLTGSKTIAFRGALFFCVTPYISEVVVWEPSFHFLQGLLMILLILLWVQRYIYTGRAKYVWYALLLYTLSTLSLEIFYVTPWLVCTLAIFYRFNPQFDKKRFGKVMLYVFVPMLLLFVARFITYRVVYGDWVSRIGSAAVTAIPVSDFGKPIKYLFHLLFLGRFFSHDVRVKVYALCELPAVIAAFYGAIVLIGIYLIAKFRSMMREGRVVSLLFVWWLMTVTLLIPLSFGDLQLVLYDRYTYFMGAFFYMMLAILISFISMRYVRMGLVVLFTLVNLRFAIKVSRYWGKGERIDHALLTNLPPLGDKTVVLLNVPESMNGAAMIGSEPEGEYKFMHNLLHQDAPISNTVYDALSYNMSTPDDGAQTIVMNDSMVRVTLNQWGTWWWYAGRGGASYENADYRLNLIDAGHSYEITLKRPAQNYLLLFQVGDQWKTVDMSKVNVDQK